MKIVVYSLNIRGRPAAPYRATSRTKWDLPHGAESDLSNRERDLLYHICVDVMTIWTVLEGTIPPILRTGALICMAWPNRMSSSVFGPDHRMATVSPSPILILDSDSQLPHLGTDTSPERPISDPEYQTYGDISMDAAISGFPGSDLLDFTQAFIDADASWAQNNDEQEERNNPTTTLGLDSHDPAPLPLREEAVPPVSAYHSLPCSRRRKSNNQGRINCAPKPNENWNERLSDISAGLLQDLTLLDSGKVAGTLLFATTRQQTTMNTSETGSHQYLIEHMLNSSEELLRTLREFKLSRPRGRSGTDQPSRETNRGLSPASLTDRHAPTPSSRNTSDGSPAPAPTSPTASSHPSKRSSDESETVDPILTMLMLTCYISLLRVYREVFSLIRDSIAETATMVESNFLPTLPSIHIDGLDVAQRRDLQIRILLQASAHLIRQIDECMCAIRLDMHGGLTRRLFDIVLDVPEAGGGGDVGNMKKSLAQIVRAINLKLGNTWEF
ncbi:hypothetical protein CBS147311_824 [Penicillium roqueforti]|nr:hypothetical protein CBS147311_824 [Penicillium roqueforti]